MANNSKQIPLSTKHDDELCDTAEVWMKAMVDETEQDFILDTGCAVTSLFFSEFSAKYESSEGGEYSSAFGKAKHEKILVQSISAGPISRGPVEIRRTPKGGNDKNLFGMDLLRDSIVELALPENRLTFLDQPTQTACLNELWLDSGSIPFVEVTSGTTTAKAIWDTGAGITIVDKAFFENHQQLFESAGTTKGTDSSGASFETGICIMKSVSIGGHLFPAHRIVPLDLSHLGLKTGRGMDFILGYSTLRHAHWMMDFKNLRWGISRVLF